MWIRRRRVSIGFTLDINKPLKISKIIKKKSFINFKFCERINKIKQVYFNSGLCSRREADIYISMGEVKVNGEIINQLGTKSKVGTRFILMVKKLLVKKIYI